MKKYQVIISKAATKELRNLPKEIIPALYHKMLSLSEDPRPEGCKKLVSNKEAIWRIRVGDYRITYSI
jgi:mRNA interferase RelE/StbE